MSAERGWIGEPQPEKEWHTPAWLSEKGGPSHFHSGISTLEADRGARGQERRAAQARLQPHPASAGRRAVCRWEAWAPGSRVSNLRGDVVRQRVLISRSTDHVYVRVPWSSWNTCGSCINL